MRTAATRIVPRRQYAGMYNYRFACLPAPQNQYGFSFRVHSQSEINTVQKLIRIQNSAWGAALESGGVIQSDPAQCPGCMHVPRRRARGHTCFGAPQLGCEGAFHTLRGGGWVVQRAERRVVTPRSTPHVQRNRAGDVEVYTA